MRHNWRFDGQLWQISILYDIFPIALPNTEHISYIVAGVSGKQSFVLFFVVVVVAMHRIWPTSMCGHNFMMSICSLYCIFWPPEPIGRR